MGALEYIHPPDVLLPDTITETRPLRALRWNEVADAFAHYCLVSTRYRVMAYLEPFTRKPFLLICLKFSGAFHNGNQSRIGHGPIASALGWA